MNKTRGISFILAAMLPVFGLGCSSSHASGASSSGGGSGMAAGGEAGESSTPGGYDDPCASDMDCQDGSLCATEQESGIPRGACVKPCSADVANVCGDGFVCVAPASGTGACARTCSKDADCAAGRICDAGAGYCAYLCTTDADCASGHCDPYSGTCGDGASTTGLGINAPCDQDRDCRSNYCNPASQRCTTVCSVSRSTCPDGSVCVSSVSGRDEGGCFPACLANNSCADRAFQCGKIWRSSKPACALPNGTCLGDSAEHVYGGNCACKADCPSDATCLAEGVGSGSPSGFCGKACAANADCGDGYQCIADFCHATCTEDSDCPRGDLCGAGQVCISVCENDQECSVTKCNRETGTCGTRVQTGAALGSKCKLPGDCASHSCLALSTADGFCSRACDPEPNACSDTTRCGESDDGQHAGVCLPTCKVDSDCPILDLNCVESGQERICDLPPPLVVPTARDAAIADACAAAVKRDQDCSEQTVGTNCEHAALVEGPLALASYLCVAKAPCGQAASCLPAPTTLGDDACKVAAAVCGSSNADVCNGLNVQGGWLRQAVVDALQICYQRRACAPFNDCTKAWINTAFQ